MLCKYQKHVLMRAAVSILMCCLALVVWSVSRSVGITMEVTPVKSDGPPPAENGNSSEPLILGVDTRQFLAEIGASTPEKTLLGFAGVHYLFLQPQAGGAKDITLGVYPSVERAKEKYQEYLAGAARPLITDYLSEFWHKWGVAWSIGMAAGYAEWYVRKKYEEHPTNGWRGAENAYIFAPPEIEQDPNWEQFD